MDCRFGERVQPAVVIDCGTAQDDTVALRLAPDIAAQIGEIMTTGG